MLARGVLRFVRGLTTTSRANFAYQPGKVADDFRSPMRAPGDFDDAEQLIGDSFVLDPRQHEGTVIFLHGIAQSQDKLKTLVEMAPPGNIRWVVPRAPKIPFTAWEEDELRTWFDQTNEMVSKISEEDEDERGIIKISQKIRELIDQESERIDPGRVFLAGFAQGAAMALHCGLSYPKKLGGIISFSGFVPLKDIYPEHINPANKSTKVLAWHGRADQMVPSKYAQDSYQVLKNAGVPVEYRELFEAGHYVDSNAFVETQFWLRGMLSKIKAQSSK